VSFGDNTGSTPVESNTYFACAGESGGVFFAGGWTNAMSITGEVT